jgi:alpha-ketoglutarate-dependent taurine dioxygenase
MEQGMTSDGNDRIFTTAPLPDATFGKVVRLRDGGGAEALLAAMRADPDAVPGLLYANDGLLMLPGMDAIADNPQILVELSRFFGPEVENYRQTLTLLNQIHEAVPEILVVSNVAPTKRKPPVLPEPPLTADGTLPTQFPHRRGWHTDQSYRRPPPDISLFFAVRPSPQGQGQTLFANGYAAYEALPADLKRRVDGLVGLHVKLGTGRSEKAVRAGEPVLPLLPHEQPQRQPVVRVHPVTGRRALYLCEASQMDWVGGPFVGMEPGPDGDGARLLYEIMAHYTQPQFTYVHEWTKGDLIIWDNRNLVHVATWFDAERIDRIMWRTTVRGNPGVEYAGERRSWIPAENEPAPVA